MAMRLLAVLCTLVPVISHCPVVQPGSTSAADPARHVSGASPAIPRQRAAAPAEPTLPSDVPAVHSRFAAADLDALVANGRATLETPEGPMTLDLVATRRGPGGTHLRVRHGDLVGTITRRGPFFRATLAGPRAVYRLSGDAQGSTLTEHRVLDYRNVVAADFAYAPP